MQKEEKIVTILLFMALGSLTMASWALGDFDDIGTDSADPESVTIEGKVRSIQPTKNGGHLIIQLDSTTAPVFVHQKSGAEHLANTVQKGDLVRVKGEVAEYEGDPEIVIKGPNDVVVLS